MGLSDVVAVVLVVLKAARDFLRGGNEPQWGENKISLRRPSELNQPCSSRLLNVK